MIKQVNVKGSYGNSDVGLIVVEGDTTTSPQSHQGDGRAIVNLFRTILPNGTVDVILLELLQGRDGEQSVFDLKFTLAESIIKQEMRG